MRTRMRRELLLPRRVVPAAGGGPATEDVAMTSGTLADGSLVGGASLVTVLAVGADGSYVLSADDPKLGSFLQVASAGFADLTSANGRAVDQFWIIGRALKATGTASLKANPLTSPDVSEQSSAALGSSMADFTIGPFTRPGGGNWTEAEFNAMTLSFIALVGSPGSPSTGSRLAYVGARARFA